ncbi:hypothetical protein LEN26_016559 [Aphanomyces euteiches]|nr:hypothetical protein LEN26_016559 [Aphanomyces euteiches]KAH9103384.1 hypothetical protein AeMF1_020270 [Aphanomyces euteiches]KAH9187952.1 hypothetical protein AeNC1_010068 [Aphanomyces euteiches]
MPLVVAVTLVLSMFGVQAERILTTCRHAATGNSTPCVNDTIQGKTIDLPVFTGRTEGYFIYNFSHLELTSIETDLSFNNLTNLQLIASTFPYFDGYLGMLDLRGNPNLVLTIDIGVYTQLNNDKFYLGIDQPSNSTAALKACWGNQSFVRPIQTFDLIYEYGHGALGYGYDNDWKSVNVCCLGCTEPYTLVHTRAPTPKPTRGPAFGIEDPKAITGVTVIVVIASIALFALLVTLAKKFIDKRRLARNATPTTTGQAPYVEQL